MQLPAVIFLGLTALFSSCAAKHLAPAPVVGVDIVALHKGDSAPFEGTEFSPFYLNEYLQYKVNK